MTLWSGTSTTTLLAAAAVVGFGAPSCGGMVSPEMATSMGGATATATSSGAGGSALAASGGAITAASATVMLAAGGSTTSAATCSATNPTAAFPAFNFCGATVEGMNIAKGVPCAAADPQQCYRVCGPLNIGRKSLTCMNAVYVEEPTCEFSAACDYSCFKLPETADPSCPALAPRPSNPCALPPCVVCGGTATALTTGYVDASIGAARDGMCVCRPEVFDANGTVVSIQKWACGTRGSSWPCPGNPGC